VLLRLGRSEHDSEAAARVRVRLQAASRAVLGRDVLAGAGRAGGEGVGGAERRGDGHLVRVRVRVRVRVEVRVSHGKVVR